jgi:hypothetical protein
VPGEFHEENHLSGEPRLLARDTSTFSNILHNKIALLANDKTT